VATSLDPSKILSQLTAGFMKLPLTQKILMPLLLVGSVMGLVWVAKLANSPDYAVLYSNLEPADASSVIDKLKAQKIKYEIRGDGSTIAISPPDMVHELRISLAGDGLPHGGPVGFELLDGTGFGTTTFRETKLYQRALQGELERTIGAIEAIASARVHITMPEKTIFAGKRTEPTASVLLRLRAGGELDKKQIKGIANLVAGSIEGLKPENVSIVDVHGNLLTPKEEENGDVLGADATRLQYQRELERGYEQHVEQMLAKVIGQDKVIAKVTADMDFSQNEREEESYDPGGQVLRSERKVEEGTGATQRGGVPGVVSNLTNDPNLLAPQGNGAEQSARREEVKNYEVTKAVVKSTSPRGRLTRLSVAVLVDGTYENAPGAAPAGDSKSETPPPKVYKPLPAETISRIEGLVRSAVGFDPSRGDTITVENIPFSVPDTDLSDVLNKEATTDKIVKFLQVGLPWFALAILGFFLWRLLKFLITPTEAEVDLSRLLPTGIGELEQELEQERAKAQVPAFEPSIDLEQLEELMAENSRIVKENPHQAALLIRYWLNDGRL
jgi:flagellar M-ring protein FliF